MSAAGRLASSCQCWRVRPTPTLISNSFAPSLPCASGFWICAVHRCITSAASCSAASWTPLSSTSTCHVWRVASGEKPEDLARLKASFPTPPAAVSYILDTFPIVKRKDEAKFKGDYRTKRTILEIYDALGEAMQTGKVYQTRLNPPPADPRCCHPPRTSPITGL